MHHVGEVFESHPHPALRMPSAEGCIEACYTCVQLCTACADACLSEDDVHHLVPCIRLNMDCADVCLATGALLSRLTRGEPRLLEAQMRTCALACRACAEQCEMHEDLEHCRVCADACRMCERLCLEAVRVFSPTH